MRVELGKQSFLADFLYKIPGKFSTELPTQIPKKFFLPQLPNPRHCPTEGVSYVPNLCLSCLSLSGLASS